VTNRPVSRFLVLNSFGNIHHMHKAAVAAYQTAVISVTPRLGTLASTFAPQIPSADVVLAKQLLDVFCKNVRAMMMESIDLTHKESHVYGRRFCLRVERRS
jgi:hypothetical protein